MARHLIDSDVLIFCLRGKPSVLAFVEDICNEEVPAISSLSYFEVWVGVRPHEEEVVFDFLSSFLILPIDPPVAKQAGDYVKAYRKRGVSLSSMDTLIAATAKVHTLILVTTNIRDFPMTDIQKRPPVR
jgi:predicted nucleic acid-binding protein